MEKLNLLSSSLMGKKTKPLIEHSSYQTKEQLPQVYPEISAREIADFPGYSSLAYKPSAAMATIQDPMIFNIIGMKKDGKPVGVLSSFWIKETEEGENASPLSKPVMSFLFVDEEAEGVGYRLYSTNPNSKSMYWSLLGMEVLRGNLKIHKLFSEMDYSGRHNPLSAKVFLEYNQLKTFGLLSSGLLYYAKTRIADNSQVFAIDFMDDEKDILKMIDEEVDEFVDMSGWFHEKKSETRLTSGSENIIKKTGKPYSMAEPVVPGRKKAKSSKEERLKAFLKEDWSLMTDEEAAMIPQFLQNERNRCREVYEKNKDFLSYDTSLLIKEIHAGDLKKMSFFGPAGTGKTMTAQMIAGALHLPFQLVVGKAGVDSSVYLGYETIISEKGVSTTKWHDGSVTQAVRHGALLLFDEVNFCNPEVLGSLNTLLDGSRCLVMDSGEVVKADKHFVYVEAMNVGVGYDGTSEMNNSWNNRMEEHVYFKPFTQEEEIDILMRNTGYERREIIAKCVNIERFIREQIPEMGDASRQVISIRNVESWIRKARYTDEWVESAIPTVLAPLFKGDDVFERFDPRTLDDDSFLSIIMQEIQERLGLHSYEEE